ncbi:MAG TPA: GerMN domain-containing protein [Acidimicrobiia bacterium]|nr:GerMN domain-containing protein [Acidimicrobiia bacterium]
MKRLATALIAVLVLVSCQSDAAADETTTLSPTTSADATTTPTVTATTTTAPATTTVTVPEVESAIYLFFEGYPVAPGPYLTAVSRPGIEDLGGALNALLEGVTDEEAAMGLSSTIPDGTELLGVEVADGVALVDLSREFESGGGSLSMMGRVAQIVYTATRFDDVDSVRFLLEGDPLDVLGGEGLIIDEPQTRSAWVELVPPILIEEPLWGSSVGREIDVTGSADLESGAVSFVIVDADGLIVHEGEVGTSPGERSEYATSVVLEDVPHPGKGSIIVWEWAADGSQQHVLEYPLTLTE